MSFPPALLSVEGWISVCVCYIVYTVSFVSLGKKSLVHAWLFTGLNISSPTDESVATVVALNNKDAHTRQHDEQSTIAHDRLATLQFESTRIQPGMITMNSLESNDGIRLWTNLDNATVCAFCCIFALVFQYCVHWFFAWKQPCCADISCWVAWWQRHQNAVPLLSLLALMAFHSAWMLGKLSCFGTDRFSSYISGILLGLAAFWMVHTPALLEILDIDVHFSLEEASARILLWARLVGIRIANEEGVLKWLINVGKLVFAVFAGSLGLVLLEPILTTSRLTVYRFQQVFHQQEKKRWMWCYSLISLASLFFLPLLILLTYLFSDRGNVFRIRTLFTWMFVCVLCSVIPDLLQSYMDQAIPAVSIILSEPSPPNADRIMYPFRSRFQRLVHTGSLLVTFPFILIALVMVGHLCNVHSDIYPIAYKGMILDKSARTTLHYWEKKLVVEMANSATSATGFIAQLSPTRANACGERLQPNRKYRKKIRNGRELILMAKPVRKSLAQAIGGIQVLRLMAREDQIARKVLEHTENMSAKDDDDIYFLEDTGKSADDLVAALTAVLLHPVLTSTVVFPLVDLMGFLLCIFWLVTLAGGVFLYRQSMLQLANGYTAIAYKKNK
jgi:hypothetical protein